ncbi:MAG: methylmalonyl-CoA mutase family protein, partial [Eubacteriales bacterium]|nr:methylmalonyl-CoA mutase family protein [Eubacteriales bacterium]
LQNEIQDSAYRYQLEIEKKERIIVGVNQYQMEEKPAVGLIYIDREAEALQKQRLASLKNSRDKVKTAEVLEALRTKAGTSENLMPLLIDAVESYATIGEICGVLREAFGEYKQMVVL